MPKEQDEQKANGFGDSVGAAVLDAHQQLSASGAADEHIRSEVVAFGAETNGPSGVIRAWATVKRVQL